VLHAEDQGVFELLDNWRSGAVAYRDYESRRPRTGGIVAAAAVIRQVERSGARAHVVHVSTREEADLYAAAAAAGLPITFEVTAHHLSFTDADLARYGSRIRLSPAIRQDGDQDRLWEAVFSGEVSTLGSDHAPHLMKEKCRPAGDAPPGLPGVQELATAVFTGMRRRQPFEHVDEHARLLARLYATNPADLFGLAEEKGRLAAGLDADLVLFDPDSVWSLRPGDVRAKCGWSAYAGWMFTGQVTHTVRRGEVVYDAATATFGSPSGRWLDASTFLTGRCHAG
jgi:dihydroorotase